jgi:Holliday junction resolvase RusA-like endonuclease
MHQRPHISRYHTFGTQYTVRTPCREATKDELSEAKEKLLDFSKSETLPKKGKIKTDNGVSKATVNGHLETLVSKEKRKKRKTPQGPSYWRNEADVFLLQNQDLANVTCLQDAHLIRFQIRGNPRPLRRHRTAKGFMYNPSSKFQESFRNVVEEMFSDKENPLFVEEHQLAMKIIFHMKRPRNHFVSSKPGHGRLKPGAPPRLSPTRTDVDNLAKFVLDSLNGVLYVDDKQVASLSVLKIYDNDGHCEGYTEVSIVRLSEQHVDDLLQSGVQPFG